ncbi:hypothetical protein [Methylobacterium segetis]|uniref:hypothetical protein n=1 Tax=Methylobacterium segetis TaxID=2488750 RepID=UPI001046C8E4|nr:hypothetical protein [Methylobacterium segetis]
MSIDIHRLEFSGRASRFAARGTIERDQLIALLNAETWRNRRTVSEWVPYRNAAIVALSSLCGASPRELSLLNVGNWRPGGRSVLSIPPSAAMGGHWRSREIPVLETARIVVGRYLGRHPGARDLASPLLITKAGTRLGPKSLNHLDRRALTLGICRPGERLTGLLRSSFEQWVGSAGAEDGAEEALLGYSRSEFGGDGKPPPERHLRTLLERVHPLAKPDRRIWASAGSRSPAPASELDQSHELLASLRGGRR